MPGLRGRRRVPARVRDPDRSGAAIVPVGPVRTVRADPIGLVRRELLWTDSAELVVHPRTIGVPQHQHRPHPRPRGHARPAT